MELLLILFTFCIGVIALGAIFVLGIAFTLGVAKHLVRKVFGMGKPKNGV